MRMSDVPLTAGAVAVRPYLLGFLVDAPSLLLGVGLGVVGTIGAVLIIKNL
jgi:hypothetical protein